MELFREIDDFLTCAQKNKTGVETKLAHYYNVLEEEGINLNELKDILEEDSTTLVVAGAGAGKTTMLVLKLLHGFITGRYSKIVSSEAGLITVPSNILVSTFLKTGATDLSKTFYEWAHKVGLGGLDFSSLHFKTIHSEVYDTLKAMGVCVEILQDTFSLVKAAMSTLNVRIKYAPSAKVTVEEIKDVSSILSYARNMLDNKKYEHKLMREYGLDMLSLDLLLETYAKIRRVSGKLDFEDLQELLLEGAKTNQNVRDFISTKYDFVFVDEFQDVSQLQYALLQYYFKGSKQVICVGDDDQMIYGWRGSDNEIILRHFIEDYTPKIRNLTTNYRCASNFVEVASKSIGLNKKRHKKNLKGVREKGCLSVVRGKGIVDLIDEVKLDVREGKEVGIIARVNDDLLIPAILLELDNFTNFSISKSISLQTRLPKQVFGCLDLLTSQCPRDMGDLLGLFLPQYASYEVDKVVHTLSNNRDMTLLTMDKGDILQSIPKLSGVILGLQEAVTISKVEGYKFLLGYLLSNVYTADSVYADKARTFTLFILDIIEHHPKVKGLDIYGLSTLFKVLLPQKLKARMKYVECNEQVSLTTLHNAKGKEWDSVYVWNVVEGRFPNIVSKRSLTLAEVEEERRIFYIAMTRAKTKLTLYTTEHKESRFLKECDLV